MANGPTIDVTEMIPVHNVFRDTLAAAPDLVGGAAADDTARRALLANFYENVIAFLHSHHEGEEELVFPLLRERRPDDLALIDEIAGQHRDVDALVGESVRELTQWSSGDVSAQRSCAETLSTLGQRMEEHLDDEEQRLLPLCEEVLSPPEWGALPAHGMASFTGDKIWLVIGLIQERMSDEQRALMLEHMPPPAVEMWTSMGERSFNETMQAVGAPLDR